MRFQNQVAISTGAASGMGLLFAECFAAEGGNVLLCDVNEAVLNEKVAAINAKGGGRAIGMVCDVRDYAQVCAARDKAVAEFGSIDIMANFAGGTATRMCKVDREKYPEFPDVPIDVYDWGIDVNLKGPFYFAHAVLKQMREQQSGLILNIGSVTGAEGSGYGMDYSTSKAGLMYGLTKSIAQFGAKYGIRCVCVSPGPVLTRAAMANMKTPMGRAAEPQEIIDLILFIASEQGQFINGENIMIDGGRNAMGRRI
ncbi:MAG: SDR family oxidoreductase [Clostridia bacterium]|nr:SDR family oxidoreductase [Clostridia bacterium]MBQ7090626.1 SDR family oxidoreductase [Clostridia bacterium]